MVVRCSRAFWPGARKHASRRISPSATRNCCRPEFPARHPRLRLVRSGARAPRPENSRCADRSIQRGVHVLSLTPEDACAFHHRPRTTHKAPFDRMLIWQAIRGGHTPVTRDTDIKLHTGRTSSPHFGNGPCFGRAPGVHGPAALPCPLVDFLSGLERTPDSLLPPRLRAAPARAVPSVFRAGITNFQRFDCAAPVLP